MQFYETKMKYSCKDKVEYTSKKNISQTLSRAPIIELWLNHVYIKNS